MLALYAAQPACEAPTVLACPLSIADGYNDVADDASMGWARYAHSMRVFVLNSGLFYIRWVLSGVFATGECL